jgi:hypothetical protein
MNKAELNQHLQEVEDLRRIRSTKEADVPEGLLFPRKRNIVPVRRAGPSIADRLARVEDPQIRMDLLLKACQQYTDVSEGTKRKWRKIALNTPGVVR